MFKTKSESIVDLIIKQGDDVHGTYELKGHVISLKMQKTEDIVRRYSLDEDVLNAFCRATHCFNKIQAGPYDTSKYLHLFPALKKSVKHLAFDCKETRRCVIQFPEGHCFQSIQFLLRDNTVNVVCFMRSCDAIKNLPYDIWLCSYLADVFANYVEEVVGIRPYLAHNIKMMFGSLHVYKEDI